MQHGPAAVASAACSSPQGLLLYGLLYVPPLFQRNVATPAPNFFRILRANIKKIIRHFYIK